MHYRPDIDGLRALAVLAVVAFHAFPVWLKGGFIGVDIFFVISGYLISTIIFNNLDRNTFSFSDFYQRRIRRIFPALLLVLTISLSLGWFTLLADEYHQLGKHVFAGTAFISNFVLWAESGYFDNAANTKPLLHLWSLGIEEQFYLIWPILVWLAWHKKWVTLLIIFIFVLSFILNTVIINYDSVATFYSPFTRFWELSSGSLLAWITFKKRLEPSILPQPVLETISFIGLGILGVAVLIINKNDSFPGWWALLPVSGTMLLIYVGNRAWINHIFLSNKLLVWFGLISFPLYLWHWPIISFGTIAEGELPSTTFRIFAVLISIFLAWVTYRYIEKPIRSGKGSKYITILSTLAILVGLSGSAVSLNNGLAQRSAVIESDFTEKVRRQFMGALWEYTSNNTCLNEHPFKLSKSLSWWFCMKNSSGSPNIIILGTSYANQLYPGFVNNPLLKHHTVLSIGTCDIVGNKIQIFKPDHPCYREKQKIQQQFIDSIIENTPELRYIIISGLGALTIEYMSRLKKRIDYFERLGKKVIIFSEHITPGFNPKVCFKTPFRQAAKDCYFSINKKKAISKRFKSLINYISKTNPEVKFFEQNEIYCESDKCSYVFNRMPLHRDNGHMSEYGSIQLQKYFTEWAINNIPEIFKAETLKTINK